MTFSPKESNDIQELWLDLLCIESIIRIIWIKGFTPKIVYYCQASSLVKHFLKIISLLSQTTFSQITDIESGELRMKGVCLYELIHTHITLFLEKTAEEWFLRDDICNLINKQSYNPAKAKTYLMMEAFFMVYRPIELICLAQKLSRTAPTVILYNNLFAQRLCREYKHVSLVFYNIRLSHYFPFLNRWGYWYDITVSGKWFYNRFINYLKILIKWLIEVVEIATTMFLHLNQPVSKNTRIANIGVEFTQTLFRPDENNDLFWFPLSQIAGNTVYHIETLELDEKSQQNLSKCGVHRLRLGNISTVLKRITRKYREDDVRVVIPGRKYIIKGLFSLLKLNRCFLGSAENSWLHLCLLKYEMDVGYWQSIYSRYGIKIIWSMLDGGIPQLVKAQAIENLGGIYTGSHFSNFFMYKVDNQKCYDVFIVWADYFLKNIFTHYSYPATFVAGYPSDHYFEKHRNSAIKLRNQYSGKFIISYQDNAMGGDTPYSTNMQLNLHKMFIDILMDNSKVVLFLKPKKKFVFDAVKSLLPELENLIEQGRIVVFFGESPRKAIPALIGMASDLVVGLGISTVAAECHFAGTLAFHADLSGMVNNDFGNRGLGKIVFRNIDTLKQAIQNCIKDGTSQRYQEAKEIYKMLDPFQDGMAYRRVGWVLKHLQDMLMQGESRERVMWSVKQRYEERFPASKELLKEPKRFDKEDSGLNAVLVEDEHDF